MSGPTLFRKGKLQAHKFSESQAVLDDIVPIEYIMNWFEKRNLKPGKDVSDRILVLKSSTGSGKSTTLPPEYYHRFWESDKRNICCTQPKVLTSIEVPKQILPYHTADFLASIGKSGRTPLKMGENIGFQNGVVAKKPTNGIIFMTIGVLQQQLNVMSDEDFAKKYSIIFVDEVHERSDATDFTLYIL